MYVKNGQEFNIYVPNEVDDFQYPAGYFEDAAERQDKGIHTVVNSTPPAAPVGKKVVLNGFYEEDGQWFANWIEVDKTGLELEAEKPPVPTSVTRRQARQALLIRGLLDDVEPAIAALDDGTLVGLERMRLAQIEWEDSLEFLRARPLVIQVGAALGLDSEGLDDLFIFAATL
jgi:hypothetical protein